MNKRGNYKFKRHQFRFVILVILLFVQFQVAFAQVDSAKVQKSSLANRISGQFAKISTIKMPALFKSKQTNTKAPIKRDTTIVSKAEKPKVEPKNPKRIQFHLPQLPKISFKTNPTRISRTAVRKLKKKKIEKLTDNVINLNETISYLEQKKQNLENRIVVLSNPDSVRKALAVEIADFKTPAYASIAVPVGFTDIDEQVRNLVLLDKIPTDNNLTVRPYYTNSKLTYAKLLSIIDTSIHYNGTIYATKNTNVTLLPISFLQKVNTDHPYGWNDGAMSFSKGYQFQVSGGVYAHWHKLKIQLRPEYLSTASSPYDTSPEWGKVSPAYKKILPGQSSIRVDLGKVSFGISTQNLWWGPGIYNSMLMSNNAEGFFHYSINTNRPIKNFLGTFQFQLIAATLTQDSAQGFENNNLRQRGINKSDRYLSSLAIDYQPSFLKNISFGINRSLQNYKSSFISGFVNKNIPVLSSFFGSTDVINDTFPRDQTVSIYTKWMFPKSNAELYYQFAYNDAKANWRDFWLDMSHSTAYLLGFKKIFPLLNENYLDCGVEVMRLTQTPSYIHRNAGNFYEHSTIIEGYSNQNQTIGAGAGMGNNVQTIALSLNKKWNKFGFIFNHIAQNPMALVGGLNNIGLRTVKWNDFSYGLQTRYKYKKILFSANVELVKSKNYLWVEHNNTTNFYAFLNTIFLW